MILRGSYGVWIIGCVACLTAFMSVFFSSRKTVFKKLARHLLDTWLSIKLPSFFFLLQSRHLLDTFWIDRESSYLLDSFSMTARSIDWASVLDIVDCSSTHASVNSHLLDTYLDRYLDTFICRDLLMAYIFSSCDPQLISVDLSLDTSAFSSPQPLSLTPNLFPWDSQAFSSFSSLGKLLIFFIYMHFIFWNLSFGVFENFGVFQNWWVIVEILG